MTIKKYNGAAEDRVSKRRMSMQRLRDRQEQTKEQEMTFASAGPTVQGQKMLGGSFEVTFEMIREMS